MLAQPVDGGDQPGAEAGDVGRFAGANRRGAPFSLGAQLHQQRGQVGLMEDPGQERTAAGPQVGGLAVGHQHQAAGGRGQDQAGREIHPRQR